jgi:hypothetical protein
MAAVPHGVITRLSRKALSQSFEFYVSRSRVGGGTSIAYRIHPALAMEKLNGAGLEAGFLSRFPRISLAHRLVSESSGAPFLAPTDIKLRYSKFDLA